MEERRYKLWDIIIKAFGFLATAATILIGLMNFSMQQRATLELEFKRSFWQRQSQLFAEVCRNAGSMAANLDDPKTFEAEKKKFLSFYYGDLVLVEDAAVSKAMVEIKSYLDVFKLGDAQMEFVLKQKILRLAEACKSSSETYKRANL